MLAYGIAGEGSRPSSGPFNLVEELNHRVINEYAEAISALSVAARTATFGAKAVLDEAAERLRNHAECHRALHPQAPGLVNLADHLARICRSYTDAVLAGRGVHLSLDCDDIWLESDISWRVGLIIAELVRNAARQGLQSKEGRIFVRVSKRGGQLSCRVSDTGGGMPGASPGRGQDLIRSLAAELGGTAEWVFTPLGNCALLRIPEERRIEGDAQ